MAYFIRYIATLSGRKEDKINALNLMVHMDRETDGCFYPIEECFPPAAEYDMIPDEDKAEYVADYCGVTDCDVELTSYHETDWDESEQYFRKIAKAFPDLLICVEGYGVDSYGSFKPDVWRKYYRHGKETVVKAKLAFPDIEPEFLN